MSGIFQDRIGSVTEWMKNWVDDANITEWSAGVADDVSKRVHNCQTRAEIFAFHYRNGDLRRAFYGFLDRVTERWENCRRVVRRIYRIVMQRLLSPLAGVVPPFHRYLHRLSGDRFSSDVRIPYLGEEYELPEGAEEWIDRIMHEPALYRPLEVLCARVKAFMDASTNAPEDPLEGSEVYNILFPEDEDQQTPLVRDDELADAEGLFGARKEELEEAYGDCCHAVSTRVEQEPDLAAFYRCVCSDIAYKALQIDVLNLTQSIVGCMLQECHVSEQCVREFGGCLYSDWHNRSRVFWKGEWIARDNSYLKEKISWECSDDFFIKNDADKLLSVPSKWTLTVGYATLRTSAQRPVELTLQFPQNNVLTERDFLKYLALLHILLTQEMNLSSILRDFFVNFPFAKEERDFVLEMEEFAYEVKSQLEEARFFIGE